MLLLFARVVALPSPFVLWSTSSMVLSLRAFLWQWNTLLDKWLYYEYIPADITLIKIK
jgi:hypothetical protein